MLQSDVREIILADVYIETAGGYSYNNCALLASQDRPYTDCYLWRNYEKPAARFCPASIDISKCFGRQRV
jgi:hypothetical protein